METKEILENTKDTLKKQNSKENKGIVDVSRKNDLLIDEPMDLTFTSKPFKAIVMECELENNTIPDYEIIDKKSKAACINISKIIEMRNFMITNNTPKKRGRKRKIDEEENELSVATSSKNIVGSVTESADCLQNINSKEAEVLKAAKSLFSKRTQTLYHWLYPNTPKSQLKAAVAVSWETLGIQEKEFYVSQVLGRFGFPQSSLMVNPQLGGIQLETTLPPLDLTLPHPAILESKNAIKTILKSEPNNEINNSEMKKAKTIIQKRKRGKIGRPPKNKNQNQLVKEDNVLKQIQNDNHDDFQDDPELSREFAQFKWSLHLN